VAELNCILLEDVVSFYFFSTQKFCSNGSPITKNCPSENFLFVCPLFLLKCKQSTQSISKHELRKQADRKYILPFSLDENKIKMDENRSGMVGSL